MSAKGQRARARAERERASTERAAQAAARAEVERRRAARRARLTGWLPRRSGSRSALAARRRQQRLTLGGGVVTVLVLVFALSESWGLTGLVAVACLLGLPVFHTLLFRR